MRTRKDIEEDFKLVMFPTIEGVSQKVIIEVLLDIRELLQKSAIEKDKNGIPGSMC